MKVGKWKHEAERCRWQNAKVISSGAAMHPLGCKMDIVIEYIYKYFNVS